MPRCNFKLELAYPEPLAGVDEAGCAPLAGPVVAGAIILDRRKFPRGIDDSKKLPIKEREAPAPSFLWPPNGRLVPVAVDVRVADQVSGPDGFTLTDVRTSVDAAADDVAGFEVGTADDEGLLRAQRPGTATERVYELVYVGRDAAGNEAGCVARVLVPHDQRD